MHLAAHVAQEGARARRQHRHQLDRHRQAEAERGEPRPREAGKEADGGAGEDQQRRADPVMERLGPGRGLVEPHDAGQGEAQDAHVGLPAPIRIPARTRANPRNDSAACAPCAASARNRRSTWSTRPPARMTSGAYVAGRGRMRSEPCTQVKTSRYVITSAAPTNQGTRRSSAISRSITPRVKRSTAPPRAGSRRRSPRAGARVDGRRDGQQDAGEGLEEDERVEGKEGEAEETEAGVHGARPRHEGGPEQEEVQQGHRGDGDELARDLRVVGEESHGHEVRGQERDGGPAQGGAGAREVAVRLLQPARGDGQRGREGAEEDGHDRVAQQPVPVPGEVGEAASCRPRP